MAAHEQGASFRDGIVHLRLQDVELRRPSNGADVGVGRCRVAGLKRFHGGDECGHKGLIDFFMYIQAFH